MTALIRGLIVAALAAGVLNGSVALAQAYPAKPVYWIVTGAPGSAPDIVARALQPLMAKAMGQPQIIETRAGSTGIAAAEYVAKAPADGYRLLLTSNSALTLVKLTHANLPYEPQRDLVPISLLAHMPQVLFVHASVPATTFPELLAFAKAHPGKLNYGSGGIGHALHFSMELLKLRSGLDIFHVPYKTVPGALQDLVAGRIQAMLFNPSDQLMAQVREGKILALASATEKRIPRLQNTPTFGELGIGNFEVPAWIGMAAPVGTSRAIVERWHREVTKAMNSPEMARVVDQLAMVSAASTPEYMADTIDREIKIWSSVARSVGIRPE